MIVRCGRCHTEFQAPGEGRFACPACGAANDIRSTPMPEPGLVAPPPPPEPDAPSPRVQCGACGFRFIVGDVATAPCPMCGVEVEIDRKESAS